MVANLPCPIDETPEMPGHTWVRYRLLGRVTCGRLITPTGVDDRRTPDTVKDDYQTSQSND